MPADPVQKARSRQEMAVIPEPCTSIDVLLARARARLVRLSPQEAYHAQQADAVLVDVRSQADREAEGMLPGAVVIERTVLEWRLDPASDSRLPFAAHDLHVVIVCSDGYASSLAAAILQRLGVHRATDLAGGYRAWKAAGLPTGQAHRALPEPENRRQQGK